MLPWVVWVGRPGQKKWETPTARHPPHHHASRQWPLCVATLIHGHSSYQQQEYLKYIHQNVMAIILHVWDVQIDYLSKRTHWNMKEKLVEASTNSSSSLCQYWGVYLSLSFDSTHISWHVHDGFTDTQTQTLTFAQHRHSFDVGNRAEQNFDVVTSSMKTTPTQPLTMHAFNFVLGEKL